uniref:Pyrin domain-containing protein n=1 Tax=Takifugu rubripes TaxID=31033 RepID=A0A3B5KC83_TAKRU
MASEAKYNYIILEDLLKEDFKTFKWYLTLDLLENCNPIPRAHLQDASRIETVDKLLRSYSEETAVKITNEALRRMNMTKASEELMSAYAPGETDRNTTHRSVSDSVF